MNLPLLESASCIVTFQTFSGNWFLQGGTDSSAYSVRNSKAVNDPADKLKLDFIDFGMVHKLRWHQGGGRGVGEKSDEGGLENPPGVNVICEPSQSVSWPDGWFEAFRHDFITS